MPLTLAANSATLPVFLAPLIVFLAFLIHYLFPNESDEPSITQSIADARRCERNAYQSVARQARAAQAARAKRQDRRSIRRTQ